MFELLVPAENRELLARVQRLSSHSFAPRAAEYDRKAVFPTEDFEDIYKAGLFAPAIPREHGGLGFGPYRGDVFTLWMMTKEIAKADLSLARCWEGHVNSLVLLDGMATEQQKREWFAGVTERGEQWVAWSGEPQSPAPGEAARFGTRVERVDGGFMVDGTKAFATSSGHAQWAILLVSTAGPGGARHGSTPDSLLLLACNLSDPSISFDASWWDPIGMRATVSHVVKFNRTFIPASNQIGDPGQYLAQGWQACFTPHYAASFLGAAEAAYDLALVYIAKQGKQADPFVQQHVAEMAINIETCHLWLRHVATLWETGRYEEAKEAGGRARAVAERMGEETIKHCIHATGARSLNRPSPIERIYRDLSFYVRHDNLDHILASIGKSVLGQPADLSFFRP
jgi:alkylation response protein AidB-like acyl-CoA dehydrogenase